MTNATIYVDIGRLGENEERLTALADDLKDIALVVKNYPKVSLYYDRTSLLGLLDIIEEFEQDLTELNKSAIFVQDFTKQSKAWQDHSFQQSDANYYYWNYYGATCQIVTHTCLAELTERILSGHSENFLFLQLGAFENQRDFFPVFKDAVHLVECPTNIVKIQYADCREDLYEWLIGLKEFSLKDKTRFEHTNYIREASKQRIYRELKTNYLWYFDNYHGTHYEVFNQEGNQHIGEADLEGNIDTSKASPDKKLSF